MSKPMPASAILSILGMLFAAACWVLTGYFMAETRRLRQLRQLRKTPRPLASVPDDLLLREVLYRYYLQSQKTGDTVGLATVREYAAKDPGLQALLQQEAAPGTLFTTTTGRAQA